MLSRNSRCLGSPAASRKASARVFTTAGSMPFGPTRPPGLSTAISRPSSLTVGTSGKRLARVAVKTASRRSLPDITSGAQPEDSDAKSISPPISARSVSAVPR